MLKRLIAVHNAIEVSINMIEEVSVNSRVL